MFKPFSIFCLSLCFSVVNYIPAHGQCHPDDFLALQAFAVSTQVEGWLNSTGWSLVMGADTTGCDLGTMHGVTTDGVRVTRLELNDNNLVGQLPSEIGNLAELIVLDLRDTTDAPGNEIGGSIPSTIGQLTALQSLWLTANDLTGSIPTQIGSLTQLRSLYLDDNNLTGSIPSSIGNLALVTTVILDDNNLSGAIPPTIGNLTDMFTFSARSNVLSSLPSDIEDCTNLVNLWLSFNEFSTELPSSLVNCPSLSSLIAIDYSNLGPRSIPDFIGNMTELEFLTLSQNAFNGTVPATFSNLTNLVRLGLDNNDLTGALPPILSYPNLGILFLQNNNFTGGLPVNIGNLSDLLIVAISNNSNLGGTLPASLGDLGNMNLFQATNCGFTGPIPGGLANWGNASQIQLQGNQLDGDIPDMFAGLNNLDIFYVNENQLTGPIPPSLGDLSGIFANFSNNMMTGCFDMNLQSLCDTPNIVTTAGNLFDTTWTAFCNSGAGMCALSDTSGCAFNNDLPVIEADGNLCVTGTIKAREAIQLIPLTEAPSTPVAGMMYFDASARKVRVWDGFAWQDCW